MITFSQLGMLGRLGNQLYQYATAKSVAIKTGNVLKIPNPEHMSWHGQKCLLKNFKIECEYLELSEYNNIQARFVEPDHMKWYPEIFNVPSNTDLYGFFQSVYYFQDIEDQVKKEFMLLDHLEREAEEYISSLKEDGSEIVSLHARRGDNTDGTNPELGHYYGENDIFTWDSIFGRYFKEAKTKFKDKKVKYLVFTGGSRGQLGNEKDVEWCKNNINGENILYCEGKDDIMDFAIMKACDHNITCHNTSFGWWAAYLNNNKEKIVVAPKNYFVDDPSAHREGQTPEDWHLV
tara:strand:+ start:806 stop:1678 length:873 start_codon:yes stop_codon:yes gene_type:complete